MWALDSRNAAPTCFSPSAALTTYAIKKHTFGLHNRGYCANCGLVEQESHNDIDGISAQTED